MKIEPSVVPDVDLIGPDSAEFREALKSLLGREPDETLRLAALYSVICRNNARRPIALLGVRFDMTGERGKRYSVVHYADTLRNPEKADLIPGAMRFVCTEPLYTELVLRRKVSQREADKRARMNLDNLGKAREIRASIDCAAFDDGRFEGPDSLGAFERLALERAAEIAFTEEILDAGADSQKLLARALEDEVLARCAVVRRLQETLLMSGPAEMIALARSHRPRIALTR